MYRPCDACNDDQSRKTTHKEKLRNAFLLLSFVVKLDQYVHSDVCTLKYGYLNYARIQMNG